MTCGCVTNRLETYVLRVALLARHFGRSPELLGAKEIRAYQQHLLPGKHRGASSTRRSKPRIRLPVEKALNRMVTRGLRELMGSLHLLTGQAFR
jgi:hypothetical protein